MTDLAELREVIHDEWESALDSPDPVAVMEFAQSIIRDHADLVAPVMQDLTLSAVMKMVKEMARKETEDGAGQMTLLGFPRAIAVPSGGDYLYMRSDRATWDVLAAGRDVRAENVGRAQAKLDIYDKALDTVRPIMEGTQLTLADAVEIMSGPAKEEA